MVKNAPSNGNLRGSTSTLSPHPSQPSTAASMAALAMPTSAPPPTSVIPSAETITSSASSTSTSSPTPTQRYTTALQTYLRHVSQPIHNAAVCRCSPPVLPFPSTGTREENAQISELYTQLEKVYAKKVGAAEVERHMDKLVVSLPGEKEMARGGEGNQTPSLCPTMTYTMRNGTAAMAEEQEEMKKNHEREDGTPYSGGPENVKGQGVGTGTEDNELEWFNAGGLAIGVNSGGPYPGPSMNSGRHVGGVESFNHTAPYGPPPTLFSNCSSGLGHERQTKDSQLESDPLKTQPGRYSGFANGYPPAAAWLPTTNNNSSGKAEREKTLFEKYTEEKKRVTRNLKEGLANRDTAKAANQPLSLFAKYSEDMAEASKGFAEGLQERQPQGPQPSGHLGFGSSQYAGLSHNPVGRPSYQSSLNPTYQPPCTQSQVAPSPPLANPLNRQSSSADARHTHVNNSLERCYFMAETLRGGPAGHPQLAELQRSNREKLEAIRKALNSTGRDPAGANFVRDGTMKGYPPLTEVFKSNKVRLEAVEKSINTMGDDKTKAAFESATEGLDWTRGGLIAGDVVKPLEFGEAVRNKGQGTSLITKGLEREVKEQNVLKSPGAYTQPFCDFLTENPTVWHAVQYFEKKLDAAGFKKLSERQTWNSTLEKGGKYYVSRNGSSVIAFTVGANYRSGNGVAMIAGHVDALTARLKPVSTKTTKAGYVQLGIAPYAGALNSTWWDRDLGIGGRVLVKDGTTGKIETRLVKLGWPIARIPTLAPHFGVGMTGSNNRETEAVPIIGLDYSSPSPTPSEFENLTLGGAGSFAATQPPKLVRAIAGELSIQDYSSIVNWELELYDTQPAQVGGLDKEFIFAGRIDDKLCSWAAMEGLLASSSASASAAGGEADDGIVKLVGVFDDEEIGSLLRQGARGNFLPSTVERITETFAPSSSANILSQTYANSFLISADVTHAVNPNFLSRYLENHAPRLNVGLVVCADSNGHMTTDSISTALLTRVAERSGVGLQLFMIRNDRRSGGTVGPMLSSAMGVRAIDAGIPQLSMHSIRATTGALDPGLGVKIFAGFFDNFQAIDAEFE